jgi:hypothetical protein
MSKQYAPERSLEIAPLPKKIKRKDLKLFMGEFGTIVKSEWTQNSLLIEYLEK